MRYTIGLDLGIASIGWCVLNHDKDRIEDLGVRLFTKAENPKNGEPLALPRRLARSARKRNRRKAQRLAEIRELFASEGSLSVEEIEALLARNPEKSPYQLRAEGLDRRLQPEEWFRALYHIAVRRGFQSNRRNEGNDDKEAGKMLAAMEENRRLMTEKSYRSAGEMLFLDPKFTEHKRNRNGYTHTLSRGLLGEEAQALFSRQRFFGNPLATEALEKNFLAIFSKQLPFSSPEMIRKKVGHCTFETEELRAPRRSYYAERFVLLSKLANLRLFSCASGERRLSAEEKKKIVELAYRFSKVTFKQIRQELGLKDLEWEFVGLRPEKPGKDKEAKTFVELTGFHEMRRAVQKACCKEEWEALAASPGLLDQISYILTYCKSDKETEERLSEQKLPEVVVKALQGISFDKFINLSTKALLKILPFMEKGNPYDEACKLAGYNHSKPKSESEGLPCLPPVDTKELRNPVVLRALSQTRKVVNAIVRRYGPPFAIHVETARDLANPYDVRRRIEKQQDENRLEREKARGDFRENFGKDPKEEDLLKFRLWKEQGGFCAYSGEYLEPSRLIEPGYAEIDHILPYSRSLDDSWHNKVLVRGEENRNKGKQTPYEYFGGDGERWDAFVARISTWKLPIPKKSRLLEKSLDEKKESEMRERNLSDTRYITRFAASYLRSGLAFHSDSAKDPVLTLNGRLTAFLRGHWGLLKNRKDGDLHHALDATVIAASSRAFVKRLSDYYGVYGDTPKGKAAERMAFPQPYPHYREEISARMVGSREEILKRLLEHSHPGYDEAFMDGLSPIFVSWAPSRRARGRAHEATLQSPKWKNGGLEGKPSTAYKVPLEKLTMKNIENMVGKDREKRFYEALCSRLRAFGGDGKKAFAEPFHKPCKNGQGPRVKSVRLFDPGYSGVELRDKNKIYAVAANDSMVRVDVYEKGGRNYLVPVYAADVARKLVKNRAIVAKKAEEEWDLVDPSFSFRFSIFPNDLVEVDKGVEQLRGYFVKCNRNTGGITISAHDRNPAWGEGGQKENIGVKTAKSFRKLQVNPLGEVSFINQESPPYVF